MRVPPALAHLFDDGRADLRIEIGCRFVCQNQIRRFHQGAGDSDSLLLPGMLRRRGFARPMIAERVHCGAGSTQLIENTMEDKYKNPSSLANGAIYFL